MNNQTTIILENNKIKLCFVHLKNIEIINNFISKLINSEDLNPSFSKSVDKHF